MKNTIFLVVFAAASVVSAGDAGVSDTLIGFDVPVQIGATWAPQETNVAGWLQSAAWSGSRFVAVGDYGCILTSPDGVSWDLTSFGIPLDLFDIAWSGGQFIAVGCVSRFPQYCIIRSRDGISWDFASRIPDLHEGLYGIAGSDSMYIAVGFGGQIFRSFDGDSWARQTAGDSAFAGSFYGVTWSGSQFVAVGEVWDQSTSNWNAAVAASHDGSEWTYRNLGILGLLFDVTWTGSRFVAVGYRGVWGISSGLIITSPDGIEWSLHGVYSAGYLRAVLSVSGTIIAAGDDGTVVISRNGTDWEVHDLGTDVTLSGIAASDSHVIVVGTSGTILVSPYNP